MNVKTNNNLGAIGIAVVAIIGVVCLIGGAFAHKKLSNNTPTPSKQINTQQTAVENVHNNIVDKNTQLSSVKDKKLEDIAVIATGTEYSLNKVTNPPQPVVVARELNKRVITEAGYSPTIEEIKKMQQMVDDLIQSNKQGQVALNLKDKEIDALRAKEEKILMEKNEEIDKLHKVAKTAATEADNANAILKKYTEYFGLGAIWEGLKQLAKTLLWWGIGFSVIFVILRVLSATNPIAGAVFNIFVNIGSSLIHFIGLFVPQAINVVKSTSESALVKVVDTIQNCHESNQHDISVIKSELNRKLSDAEKNKIKNIKNDLFY